MSERTSTAQERNALKTRTKQLVSALGGIDAAASTTRVGRTQIAEYGNAESGASFAPADVVLDMEKIAGKPFVTQEMARALGYALIPVQVGEGDIAAALQEISADVGKLFADAIRALATEDVLPEQYDLVHADLVELARVANHAAMIIRRRMGTAG